MRDKLDEQIASELEKYGIEVTDELLKAVRESYEAELAMRRIFEPMPDDWRTAFKVGDQIELVRPFFGIPVGITGVVQEIEAGINPDGSWKNEWEMSADFFKGRVFTVMFDCTHIPLDPKEYEVIKEFCEREGIADIPTHKGHVTTNVAPQDIQKVQ